MMVISELLFFCHYDFSLSQWYKIIDINDVLENLTVEAATGTKIANS